jgi:general nucleoside transport system permease protein
MFEALLSAVPLAIVASVPLLLAVQGELVVQRSGMINLGIEGMLLAAAFGATFGGLAGGIAGAMVIGVIFGIFSITLRADQIVTGAALNLLALGLTAVIFREAGGGSYRSMSDFITPLAWVIAPVLLAVFLWRTNVGLRIRATGDNPEALRAAGHSPEAHRWLAVVIESVLIGIAGTHLALVLSNGFAENMSAGRGYIALAVVIFGGWRVKGALLGTAVFGLAAALQYATQAAGTTIPYHLLLATPYAITLAILTLRKKLVSGLEN